MEAQAVTFLQAAQPVGELLLITPPQLCFAGRTRVGPRLDQLLRSLPTDCTNAARRRDAVRSYEMKSRRKASACDCNQLVTAMVPPPPSPAHRRRLTACLRHALHCSQQNFIVRWLM